MLGYFIFTDVLSYAQVGSIFNELVLMGISPEGVQGLPMDSPSRAKTDALIVAYRCQLQICLQTHNATATNGIVQLKLLNSMDLTVVPETSDDSHWNLKGNITDGTRAFVGSQALNYFYFLLKPIADSTVLYTHAIENVTDIGFQTNGNLNLQLWGDSAAIEALWEASNSTEAITARFQNIANSLTAYIQSVYAAPFEPRYAPTVYTKIVFVVV